MKPIIHPSKLHSIQQHPNEERTIHHTLPNVPVNSKLPIPSFYENANGQWILSDNWDLYGLSGSAQRHRARSLEEPSTLLLHHATSISMLQYELTPPNNSSNPNTQKLYLPTGWNHTSRRGPLYVTSVIVVASLLIAIAVLSTVVGLVVRRRARRRRRTRLKNSLPGSLQSPDDHPSPKESSLQDIEQVIPGIPTRPERLNQRLHRKLKQLTIIKINYLSKGRKQAKITRIPIATQPDGPPPPSVILVDQARRSTSLSSQCRFRLVGNRRRSHPRSLGPQSQPEHPSHDNAGLTSPSHMEIHIPSSVAPSVHSTHDVLHSEILQSQMTSPHDCDAPQADLSERQSLSSSNAAPNSNFLLQSNQATPSRPFISTTMPHRVTSEHGILSRSADTLRYRQDFSRASVDPNYRSCHDMIRARSSTISALQTTHLPVASSSSTSFPSTSLIPNRPNNLDEISLHQPHPVSPMPSRSDDPTMPLGGHDIQNLDDQQVEETPFESIGIENRRQSESSPPAYSSQTAPAEGSRAAEKRRMVFPEGEAENSPTELQQQEDQSHPQGYYGVPLVAHVATDDKSVIKTLLKMGSAPAIKDIGSIGEDQGRIGNEEETLHDVDGRFDRMKSSGWRRRDEGYEEEQIANLIPSAPPLLYEAEGEGGESEFGLDRRRQNKIDTTREGNSKHDVQPNLGLFRELNDDQIGQSFKNLNILPLPSDQFIIRFDPENFEETNTKNTLLEPSSMHHFQENQAQQRQRQTEDLYNYSTPPLVVVDNHACNLPSAPPILNPTFFHNDFDSTEKDSNLSTSSSPRNNISCIVDNFNTSTSPPMTIDHNLVVVPSAPPLIVDDDLAPQPFVPPYAE